MPGVYPYTWLIDFTSFGDKAVTGLYIFRPTTAYESLVNTWFVSVANEMGLIDSDSLDSFRSAKCSLPDGIYGDTPYLLYPANVFAESYSDPGSIARSSFRMPVGALMGSCLFLSGGHISNLELALHQLIMHLKGILANPESDLATMLKWIVFDTLIGDLSQMPYRYQVVMSGDGLALTTVPFWAVVAKDDINHETQRQFGFQIQLEEPSSVGLLSNKVLDDLSAVAGLATGELSLFRDSCISQLEKTAPGFLRRVSSFAEEEGIDSKKNSFRNAK